MSPDWQTGDENGRLAEWAGVGRHKLAHHQPKAPQPGPSLQGDPMANGRSSPKEAALIALRRAKQEPEPEVVLALISIALTHVEAIEELKRPRPVRKEKEQTAP
jgi:hypothetical protein